MNEFEQQYLPEAYRYARSFFCIYILAAIVILLLSFAGLRLDMSQFAVPM